MKRYGPNFNDESCKGATRKTLLPRRKEIRSAPALKSTLRERLKALSDVARQPSRRVVLRWREEDALQACIMMSHTPPPLPRSGKTIYLRGR